MTEDKSHTLGVSPQLHLTLGSPIKLNEENYEIWSRMFMMSLVGHRKGHIITSDQPAENSADYKTWVEENGMVMTWITHSVNLNIASHLCFYSTAKDMWESLKVTYSGYKNVSKIYRAEQALFRLQQGELSLAQYFTAVKAAYEKLNAIRPPCSTCRESHFEKSIVTIFLSGLSSEYESSIGQILSSPELPSLEEVYSRLNRLGLNRLTTDATPASALAAFPGHGRGSFHSTRGRGGGRTFGGSGRPSCTFCGKLGHLEDKCWSKHGRPPSFGATKNTSHTSHITPPSSGGHSVHSVSPPIDHSTASETVTISRAEYERIMSQTQPASSSSTSHDIVPSAGMATVDSGRVWIVDSGASRHFCGDETCFVRLHRFTSPQFVRMADGSPSPILGYGDIMILPSL